MVYVLIGDMDGCYFIGDVKTLTDYNALLDKYKAYYRPLPETVLDAYRAHQKQDAVFQHMFAMLDRSRDD